MWDDLIPNGLQNKLSVCAVDEFTNGEMVGISICFIHKNGRDTQYKPPSLQEYIANGYSRELAYVFMLLDDIYDPKKYMRELNEFF